MATIQKRGDTYKITVSCGYDLNYKQIRRHMTWTPEPGMTKRQITKELERQKVLFEEKCRTGQVLGGNIKFADFADKWFKDYAEKQLRPTTVTGYRHLTPRTYAAIGHIRLDRLQPHHLMEFYNDLAENGVQENQVYYARAGWKDLLKSHGLTNAALAKKTGIDARKLSGVAHGRGLYLKNATCVAAALDCPLGEVFAPDDQKTKLSHNTILHYHRFISTVLSTAVKWQIIFSNPCERVQPPKVPHKEAKYLDEQQAAHLLQALDHAPEQYRVMVTVLLYTGLRRGELCGLEWKDIDFQQGLLNVRRSSLYLPGKGVFTDETKNQSSERVLKLNDSVLRLLRQHQITQNKNRLQYGDQWQESGRIFTTWNGTPIHPTTFSRWFADFAKRHDLPPITAHSLRHTNATLLIATGVNIKTVSAHLGHSNVSTTGNIYAHAIQSAEAAAADALQDRILNALKHA